MTTKTITLIEDLAKLGDAIKANAKAHTKVDQQWHVLACSAVKAFGDHGNVFYINQVYAALGKGARHVAMTEFFLQFGGVKANEGQNKDKTPFIKDATKQVDLEKAIAHPWYSLKPSKKPDEVIDYLKLAMKLVTKAPKEGQEVENADLRTRLAETLRQYADEKGIEVEGLASVSTGDE